MLVALRLSRPPGRDSWVYWETESEDMSGQTNGWVCLHRKLMESAVWGNDGLVAVWVWCLLRASHKERWIPMTTGRGKTQVHLMPGQFVTGREAAAKELSQKPTTVRNRLLTLKKLGNIDMQTDTHWTVITVCNWDIYQQRKDDDGQADGHPTDTQLTGNRQATDTNNNGNKGNKGDKGNKTDLSANADAGDVKPTKKPQVPYRQFTDYFCEKWSEHYDGEKFPFQHGKHGTAAAAIWKHVGENLDKAKAIIDRFFRNTEKFFRGHDLAKLNGNLSQFLTDAGTSSNSPPPTAADAIAQHNWDRLHG